MHASLPLCVTVWLEVKRSIKASRYGPPHLGTHRVGTRTPKRDGVHRRPSIIKKVWDPLPAVKEKPCDLSALHARRSTNKRIHTRRYLSQSLLFSTSLYFILSVERPWRQRLSWHECRQPFRLRDLSCFIARVGRGTVSLESLDRAKYRRYKWTWTLVSAG